MVGINQLRLLAAGLLLPLLLFSQTTHWRLIWDKNSEPDMSHYLIYRDTTLNPTLEIGRVNHPDTVYVDSTITPGILYYYRLVAVDSTDLYSDYSDNVSAAIPLVGDIPGQSVGKGESFTTINLDNYVQDRDNSLSEITWSSSGNNQLGVFIDVNHIATINIPSVDWTGSETITFTATDPDTFFTMDAADFTVLNNERPVAGDIPDQTVNQGVNFAQFDLDTLVSDADNSAAEMSWTYSGNSDLTVAIDADHVVTVSKPSSGWTGSEIINFTVTDPGGLSDSDAATFKSNAPPVMTDIPNQTINQGGSFTQIALDDFVSDIDNSDADLVWTYSGNSELNVTITNHIATILTPSSNWHGSETITFTATDPDGAYDSDAAQFKVNAPPAVADIRSQTINEGQQFSPFDLDTLVNDPDNSPAEIMWTFSGNQDLTVNIDANHVVQIAQPGPNWHGSETITFIATDPYGLTDQDSGVFYSNAAPVLSDIPDQLLNAGQNFSQIDLDNYVTDADNADAQLTWSFSGNNDLAVNIDANHIATILTPISDWTGSELITFRVTDPGGLHASNASTFKINAAPVISAPIPDQTIDAGQSFTSFDLDDYVTDTDNADADLTWTFSGNSNISVSINASHVVTVTPDPGWSGSNTITFTVTDPGGLDDSDPAVFKVNAAPIMADIPDQKINQGQDFVQIMLDDFVDDSDNADSELNWSWSGNSQLNVSIDVNRIARITPPNPDWYGSETIVFTASDPRGLSDSDGASFSINAPPQVNDIPDQTIYDNQTFATFDLDNYVTDAYDTDAGVSWTWSGNRTLSVNVDPSSLVTISYPTGWTGSETLVFTATDGGGLSNSDPAKFTVQPANAPVVSDIPDQVISVGQTFATIMLDNYVTDPNEADSEISWTYAGNVNLSVTITANREAIITAPNGYSGTEVITFTATDPSALSDADASSFTVNAAPVVNSIEGQTVNNGQVFNTILLDDYVSDANNTDAELVWTASGNQNIHVSISSGHTATLAYNAAWSGMETISFTATDPYDLTDVTTAEFKVNAPPVVSDIPNQFINEGSSFAQIALNDYVDDADNSDAQITWQFSGNQQLSIEIGTDNLVSVSYPAGWHGSETVTFSATDPYGLSDTDQVIFSLNASPRMNKIPDQETAEGEDFTPISLNDFIVDPDNTDSEINWQFRGNKTLQISMDAGHQVRIIKPVYDWFGTDTIQFIGSDPYGLKDSTFAIFHTNGKPQLSGFDSQLVNQGQPFEPIYLDALVTDPDDADSVLVWSASGQEELTVTIDGERVATVVAPDSNWYGSENIRFTVKDSRDAIASADVAFTKNAAPRISPHIPDQIIPKLKQFKDIPLDEFISDPDNENSEISWAYAGNKQLTLQLISGNVLQISPPAQYWMGMDTIVVTATDPMDLFAIDTLVLGRYSTNRPPQIISQPLDSIEAKQYYSYQLQVTDPDSVDTMTFGLLAPPHFLSISDSGLINGTPVIADTGIYQITALVKDMEAAADTQRYALTVFFNPSAPELKPIPGQTIVEGGNFAPITLSEYAIARDSEDSLKWSYFGNQYLGVQIDGQNIAAISSPDSNWYGSESITFRVTNRYGQFAQQSVPFTVTGINDPPLMAPIPDQLTYQNDFFDAIALDDFVQDVDNADETLIWEISGNRHLDIEINAERRAIFTVRDSAWVGSDTLQFKVQDPGGLFAVQQVRFTMEAGIFSAFTNQFVGSGTVVEVRWQSTKAVRGELFYGLAQPDLESAKEESFSLTHRVVLSGLEPNSTYLVQAAGTDSSAFEYYSKVFTVQTTAAGAINVFPNPYRAGQYPDDDVVHFANLPAGGSVIVYNLLGEPVFIVKDTEPYFVWNVTNNAGKKVQSGLYLWLVKDARNKKIKSGKIAIIR